MLAQDLLRVGLAELAAFHQLHVQLGTVLEDKDAQPDQSVGSLVLLAVDAVLVVWVLGQLRMQEYGQFFIYLD